MNKIVLKVVLGGLMTGVFAVSCGPGGGDAPASATNTPGGSASSEDGVETVAVSAPGEGATMMWVDGSVLVFVPEGEFEMGETGGTDNPLHSVQLSPFWIQRNEVTNRQYGLCIESGQCSPPSDGKRALAVEEASQADVPVAGVTWEQASAYCSWVQGSLPTEAQWEKAARGPESRLYPWGDAEPSCQLLNFGNCVGYPAIVGQYPDGQSYYTLFDMAGNVFEWAYDWYDAGYYSASPASDPTGPESGTVRVFRSSNYYSFADEIKLSRRLYMEPEKFRDDLGFRCVVQSPTIQAPYCQTSAVGIAPSNPDGSTSNSASCEPPEFEQGNAFCANGNSYANIFVYTGVLSSTDKSSTCNYGGITDGTELFTCGPGEENKEMKICGECSSLPSPSELVCPAGYTPDGSGNCIWGVVGMESVGGCPAGWTPGANGSVCAYVGPKPGENCPMGSYYDPASAACVGNIPSTALSCPAGFTYDAQAQCCAAATGVTYPGCGPSEYMNEQGFCAPLLTSTTLCTDITVSYIDCSIPPTKVPGGDDGGDNNQNGCQILDCNYPYAWDDASCSCIYNPKP